ncbi:MAG: hypothetical protein JSW27_13920 [Phycisphaerales bacterium]|nr:MAG: hypothetical protein JSW27_13920 [Phycisphaerales bacterium]
MTRQRWTAMIVVTVALTALLSELSGTTALAHPRRHTRVVAASRARVGHWVGPHHRKVVVGRPRHRRFVRIGPPCPPPVVVPRPIVRRVVINPIPPITVTVPTVRVQPARLTLWVTCSNGARISVELVKDGPWYVGPRGEYYTSIPTNEQLRVVYGF